MNSDDLRGNEAGARLPDVRHFALVYLAYLIGVLASFPVVGVLLALHSERSFFSKVIDGPAPLTVIIAGFWMGRFCYLRLPSRTALLTWIPPALFLSWSAWNWQKTMSAYDSSWDTYFGSRCGGSECLYQFFLTIPLYAALAYSIGALTNYKKGVRPRPPG